MPLKVIQRKGRPNLYLRGTVRGIRVYASTETADPDAAEAIRIKREAGILNRSVFGPGATATFLEAAVLYLEAGGEDKYLGEWDEATSKWTGILSEIHNRALDTIDQAVIDATAKKLKPSASNATKNRHVYAPIAAVLHFGADRQLCTYRRVKRLPEPEGRVRWLTPEESERLIAAAADHLKPLLIFLFATGARLSETLYLDWREVDLTARRVAFLDTKNGTSRGVPLHTRVVTVLANLKHRDGAVFRRPDGKPYKRPKKGNGGQLDTAFSGACRRAKIDDFTPHDCRHTWATWFYAKTRDLRALMELGGWKSEKMVIRYTHVNPDHLVPLIDQALPWEVETEEVAGDGLKLEPVIGTGT